jgi:subtilisin family serine protease
LLIAPLALAAPVRAAPPDPVSGFATLHLDASVLDDPGWQSEDPATPVTVLVQLPGPTTLDLFQAEGYRVGDLSASADEALDEAFATLAQQQAPLSRAIRATGAVIIDSYDTAMNGFLARGTRDQITAIAGLHGVEQVYRAPLYYPSLSHAVPMIGADEVAENLGFKGRGVNVGIIDTGIDYTHKNLGGSGDPDEYSDILQDPSKPVPAKFPNDKVIGGYDFAGRDYDGGSAISPKPDVNPIDEAGHGSHVAGIVAGLPNNAANVYHGVAPEAKLVALKVFGYRGGTNLANSAIEWAIEANMGRRVSGTAARIDVLNLSLGSAFASQVQDSVGVVQRAVDAGILVVIAAGNSGDVGFIAGSPCAAAKSLCVASTVASGGTADQIQVNQGGSIQNIEAMEGSEELSTPISEVGKMQAPLAWFGRACGGDTVNGDVEGKIVLIERGGCEFAEKLLNAAQFKAAGAVFYNDREGLFTPGATAGVAKTAFPSFMIRQADGERLRQALEGGAKMDAVLDPALKGAVNQDYLADTISSFSSRGPARNGEFKPNIAAPGSHIVAPYMGTGDKGIPLDGTSMATPMVAGAAAVIIQRLRDQGLAPADKPMNDTAMLTATDVGTFLMNYAHADVWRADNRTTSYVPLARSGAGRVDLSRAARGTTIVKTTNMASVNLGIQAFDDTYTHEDTLTLRNLSDKQRRYSVAVEFRDATKVNSGVKYSVLAAGNPVTRINITPNSTQSLKLKTEAFANQLRRYPIFGGQSAMNGDGRMHEAEYDAFVVVTEIDGANKPLSGGDSVHVPIYFLPRGASVITAAPSPIKVSAGSGQGPILLSNNGGQPGRAELFGLWAEDPIENTINPAMNIDQLGVRIGLDQARQRTVEFAVHFGGQRYTPLDSAANIFLDNDTDAEMDYRIYNTDFGAATGRGFNGQQAVVVVDIAANRGFLRYFAVTDLNSRSVVLPVQASDLGFAANEPVKFNAVAINAPTFDKVPVDVVPDGGYDPATDKFGTERLNFEQDGFAYTLDRQSMDVAASGLTVANVRTQSTASDFVIDRILALFPQNLQRRDDAQLLTIETGDVPTVPDTPTPGVTETPTTVPTATNTPLPTNTSVYTPVPSDTPRATNTPVRTQHRIYLPLLKKEQ